MMMTPTQETYSELDSAYRFFNDTLFEGALPPCLITLQRKSKALGYFAPKRFQHTKNEALTDEIAMNPDHFQTKSLMAVLSTLVHEMVHLQQEYFGTPSRRGYHNQEWSHMMLEVGLIPSDTGKAGGNRVGQRMSHYIESGGQFQRAAEKLIASGFALSWADSVGPKAKVRKNSGRVKYSCEDCGLNAWAKPNAQLMCGDCHQVLSVL